MTYREEQTITRAVESAIVKLEAQKQAVCEQVDAAFVGAEDALHEFAEAVAPLRVRLASETLNKIGVDLRVAAVHTIEIRLGEPGNALQVAEFYVDTQLPEPWRLITRRPEHLGFRTLRDLLIGLTEQTDFTRALHELRCETDFAPVPVLPGACRVYPAPVPPSTFAALLMGAMLGSGFTTLVFAIVNAVTQ